MIHKINICGVCKREFDIEEEGGITDGENAVCTACVRNHPYQTNRVLK